MSIEAAALSGALPVEQADDETADLLADARAGDQRAFERLMKKHSGRVYHIAIGILGNPDEAADVCQEVFLRFYRHIHGLRAEKNIMAWLRRVTINRCYDSLKARKRRREVGEDAREGETAGSESHDPLLRRDINRGLETLSPRERAALVLTCQQGYSSAEAAAAMGCRAATVRVLTLRAREKMRSILGPLTGDEGR